MLIRGDFCGARIGLRNIHQLIRRHPGAVLLMAKEEYQRLLADNLHHFAGPAWMPADLRPHHGTRNVLRACAPGCRCMSVRPPASPARPGCGPASASRRQGDVRIPHRTSRPLAWPTAAGWRRAGGTRADTKRIAQSRPFPGTPCRRCPGVQTASSPHRPHPLMRRPTTSNLARVAWSAVVMTYPQPRPATRRRCVPVPRPLRRSPRWIGGAVAVMAPVCWYGTADGQPRHHACRTATCSVRAMSHRPPSTPARHGIAAWRQFTQPSPMPAPSSAGCACFSPADYPPTARYAPDRAPGRPPAARRTVHFEQLQSPGGS